MVFAYLIYSFINLKITINSYIATMNVYHITNKSIQFFLDLFKFDHASQGIDKFVEVEFKEQDREWAKIHFLAHK